MSSIILLSSITLSALSLYASMRIPVYLSLPIVYFTKERQLLEARRAVLSFRQVRGENNLGLTARTALHPHCIHCIHCIRSPSLPGWHTTSQHLRAKTRYN
jgi:hypothetical protein